MTGPELLAASAVMSVGAAVQGSVGFGFALVSAPLLVMIDPRLVPGSILLTAMLLTLLTAWRERGSIDVSGLSWGTLGRLPGTALGALALTRIPPSRMGVTVGALVLVAVGMSLSGLRPRPTRATLIGAGVASGFMGTTSSIGGPPIAMVYQHAPGAILRGTLAAYFVIGCVLSLVALVLVDRFGWWDLHWSLALMPSVVLGFAVSARITPWLDRGYTRPAVLVVSASTGLLALVRELF